MFTTGIATPQSGDGHHLAAGARDTWPMAHTPDYPIRPFSGPVPRLYGIGNQTIFIVEFKDPFP
jgi:hypothetical protein